MSLVETNLDHPRSRAQLSRVQTRRLSHIGLPSPNDGSVPAQSFLDWITSSATDAEVDSIEADVEVEVDVHSTGAGTEVDCTEVETEANHDSSWPLFLLQLVAFD